MSTSNVTIGSGEIGGKPHLGNRSTTTPSTPTTPPTTAAANPAIVSVLNDYNTYDTDLSNLDYAFQSKWLIRMKKVATHKLIEVSLEAAFTMDRAYDRDQGHLVADQEVVKVSGSKASLTSCLDLKDWYLVNTTTGEPDASVARGYFIGVATAVKQKGQWYLNTWTATGKVCHF